MIALYTSAWLHRETTNGQYYHKDTSSEHELQRALLRLHYIEDEHKNTVELIAKLQKQNEELITQKEQNENEIKMLIEKSKSLQEINEIYVNDAEKQKQTIISLENQLSKLKHDISKKTIELNDVNELHQSMQEQIYQNDNHQHIKNENMDNAWQNIFAVSPKTFVWLFFLKLLGQ